MKKLLTVILLFILCNCKAQVFKASDTIPVIFLLIDTSAHEGRVEVLSGSHLMPLGMSTGITWYEKEDVFYDHSAVWMKGYLVQNWTDFVYLTNRKKILPKNFIVWDYKILN